MTSITGNIIELLVKFYVHPTITDPPSITNITVDDTGTTFITISWTSTSVGSVTFSRLTIAYSTDNVIISSFNTYDTLYTVNGLTSGTSYRISVVPSDGVYEGEGKEIMVDTTDVPSVPISDGTTTGKMKIAYKTPAICR